MRLVLETEPHLVLLDVEMPGIDGFRVAELLKKDPDLTKIPVIFLTARGAAADVVRGIQVGARHYLTKPFKLEEVRAKVQKALR
jgi:DNA-binding response OmpR family regulator